ncbi:IclR family transcriptional regulator [Mumia quercus]|uniref:IclR family transcriptional regulator n=1 Tax=Mumia quercus TaxID=2976125 RepID=UPI0021D1ACC9|nr:IclR family transcriptional regulator [Mumia quercus]
MAESTQMVGRVSALLRALAATESDDGLTTTEVGRATGLPRPTVHRLLESLAQEGMVDRDGRSGRWFLGPELFVLGARAASRFAVTDEAVAAVRRLAEATGESAFFSVRRGDETVVLLRQDGAFPIRSFVLYEGARFPLGVVSAGIVVLAYLDDREIDDYLARTDLAAAWGDAHSDAAIRDRIGLTRERGWAVNPGLVVEGSWGMAAAVFDAAGSPRWALTLTGVESRFGPDRQSELGHLLLSEAHQLSRLIG